MYSVSDAYKTAIQENTRSFTWSGKITTTAGREYPFTNEDIVKGSGYVSRQCSGSSEIELGSVYAAELGIARKYGTTVAAIQKLNPTLIKNVNLIITGWKIRVK